MGPRSYLAAGGRYAGTAPGGTRPSPGYLWGQNPTPAYVHGCMGAWGHRERCGGLVARRRCEVASQEVGAGGQSAALTLRQLWRCRTEARGALITLSPGAKVSAFILSTLWLKWWKTGLKSPFSFRQMLKPLLKNLCWLLQTFASLLQQLVFPWACLVVVCLGDGGSGAGLLPPLPARCLPAPLHPPLLGVLCSAPSHAGARPRLLLPALLD